MGYLQVTSFFGKCSVIQSLHNEGIVILHKLPNECAGHSEVLFEIFISVINRARDKARNINENCDGQIL